MNRLDIVQTLVCLGLIARYSLAAILRVGNPLPWVAARPILQYVRASGVEQFVNHYQRCKGLELPMFVWGDEIEYGVFRKNNENHFDLSLNATKLREQLIQNERQSSDLPIGCEWQPEYGSWMVEAVPKSPYGSYVSDLLNIEKSMQLRRKRLHSVLHQNEIAPTITTFPMMGVSGYEHSRKVHGEVAQSQYVSDDVITPHPRFAALTSNIRARKGTNVDIRIPMDATATVHPIYDMRDVSNRESKQQDMIHMDAMAFGMGCCCLQVTMQLRSEAESRYLHDQLLVLAPLFQALSAATPVLKGTLAATDSRWEVISQAVDDRRPAELGEDEAAIQQTIFKQEQEEEEKYLVGQGRRRLHHSRYSASSLYLSVPQSAEDLSALSSLQDLPVEMDEEVFARLQQNHNVDPVLARHIAHMFTRDPLVIFDDAVYLDNNTALDHFENIQSTNWRSLRWKPPSLRVGQVFHNLSQHTAQRTYQFTPSSFSTRSALDKLGVARISELSSEDDLRPIYTNREGEIVSLGDMSVNGTDGQQQLCLDDEDLVLWTAQRNILVCDRPHCQSDDDDDEVDVVVSENDDEIDDDIDSDESTFYNWWTPPIANATIESSTGPLDMIKEPKNDDNVGATEHVQQHQHQHQIGRAEEEDLLQSVGPGWRVEFRPLEVQLTDFENAAYAMFVVLVSRMLIAQRHSFYLPMSYVEENMRRAQLKDAVRTQKFYFPRNIGLSNISTTGSAFTKQFPAIPSKEEIEIVQLTLDEIINGEKPSTSTATAEVTSVDSVSSQNLFPGLVPLLQQYLASIGYGVHQSSNYLTESSETVNHDSTCNNTSDSSSGNTGIHGGHQIPQQDDSLAPYLQLLKLRASGTVPTVARYLREFLAGQRQHTQASSNATSSSINVTQSDPAKISPKAADALLQHCEDLGMGRLPPVHLLSSPLIDTAQAQQTTLYGNHLFRNLDAVDEEDLMFGNTTCFVRPVYLPVSSSLLRAGNVTVGTSVVVDTATGDGGVVVRTKRRSISSGSNVQRAIASVRKWWRQALPRWRRVRNTRDDLLRF